MPLQVLGGVYRTSLSDGSLPTEKTLTTLYHGRAPAGSAFDSARNSGRRVGCRAALPPHLWRLWRRRPVGTFAVHEFALEPLGPEAEEEEDDEVDAAPEEDDGRGVLYTEYDASKYQVLCVCACVCAHVCVCICSHVPACMCVRAWCVHARACVWIQMHIYSVHVCLSVSFLSRRGPGRLVEPSLDAVGEQNWEAEPPPP